MASSTASVTVTCCPLQSVTPRRPASGSIPAATSLLLSPWFSPLSSAAALSAAAISSRYSPTSRSSSVMWFAFRCRCRICALRTCARRVCVCFVLEVLLLPAPSSEVVDIVFVFLEVVSPVLAASAPALLLPPALLPDLLKKAFIVEHTLLYKHQFFFSRFRRCSTTWTSRAHGVIVKTGPLCALGLSSYWWVRRNALSICVESEIRCQGMWNLMIHHGEGTTGRCRKAGAPAA